MNDLGFRILGFSVPGLRDLGRVGTSLSSPNVVLGSVLGGFHVLDRLGGLGWEFP